VINVVVQLTIAAWLALEVGLLIRDRVRGKGSAARDRAARLSTPCCYRGYPVAATTLTDILANVIGGRVAVSKRDDRAGQDVLRRVGEASVLVLISLADGPKHGYALIQDIKQLADVELGPGTLYGALDRLERLGLIEPLPADDRRHPYRITAPGAAALRVHLDSLERVSAAGRLRLRLGGI
jgi:DNA-binding PadR family transcriptional regulator